MMHVLKYKKRRDKRIEYPNIHSSFTSVIHCPDMPSPSSSRTTAAVSSTLSQGDNFDFEVKISSFKIAHFPEQNDLDDLSQNLGIIKSTHRYFLTSSKNGICSIQSCKISKSKKATHELCKFLSEVY